MECKIDVKIGQGESKMGQDKVQSSQEARQKGELARQKGRQPEAKMPSKVSRSAPVGLQRTS